MRAVLVLLAALAGACGDDLRGNISIDPGPFGGPIGELVAFTPYRGLAIGTGGDYQITVVDDPAIPNEGYRVEPDAVARWRVHAHDVLGAQYGVAEALENLGVRFRHPFDTYVPFVAADRGAIDGSVTHRPDVRVRGFHVHTLHPVESYFALWEPGPAATSDAHRIINWVIANRGNYLQWAALDDILDPARYAPWQAFTRELIEYAHARGVRVGLNIQLFGQSNLQLAFDLSDDRTGTVPIATEIAARLPLVTQDLPFDVYDLSFGEFFASDPQKVIDGVDEVARQLRGLAPQAELHALVHVGGTQRVTYMGHDLPYYFLVQYADPAIVPDIHTVMYFDLFESAGGAYQLADFSESRQYLLDRMCAGAKAAYHPETAYWYAFDDEVPQFLPLYVRSRWRDLHDLAAAGCGALDEHLLFSTGWEWGYWLHDVATLRATYELPAAPQDLVIDALAPDLGTAAGAVVDRIAATQHDALMDDRLAAYIAGRDVVIEAGRKLGIISLPDRVTFDDLVASGDVAGLTGTVLVPLGRYADALDARQRELDALALPDDRWARELRDGLAIDRLRARFVLATYGAVVAHLAGGDAAAELARARELLAQAEAIVAGRHADLHDTHGRRLLEKGINQTEYQYGYLYMADTLCYWNRELDQAAAILGDTTTTPPGCAF